MSKRNKEEDSEIIYNGDVEYAHLGQALLAHLIDIGLLFIIWIVAYFAVCYPVTINNPGIKSANEYIDETERSLRLKTNDDISREEKEAIVKDFYFVEFPDEIKDIYIDETIYEGISLTYYYNVRVLGLEFNPYPEYEGTSLYEYVKNEDGSFNFDVIGVRSFPDSELSGRGKRDLEALYDDAIEGCLYMLQSIDKEYAVAYYHVTTSTSYGIAASFSFAYICLFAILPLLLKNKATAGEAVLRLGTCQKTGYAAKWYIVELRALIGFVLPFFGAYLFDSYSIVCLLILPIFLNFLYPLLTGKRQTLLDTLFRLRVVINKESTIYKDELDKELANRNSLAAYKDPDYVTTLASTEAMETKEEDLNN